MVGLKLVHYVKYTNRIYGHHRMCVCVCVSDIVCAVVEFDLMYSRL